MGEIQASRANTLDRILNEIDLPDPANGYFSYNVEDFFGDYVDALGQRGMQGSGSLEMSTLPGENPICRASFWTFCWVGALSQ